MGMKLALALVASLALAQPDRPRARPLPAASQGVQTGPAVGARVPAFRLTDQQGRQRDLASLTGKRGLMLYFVRSADW